MVLWSAGALYYAPLLPEDWRAAAAGTFATLNVLAFLFLPRRGRTAIVVAGLFAILVVLFLRIPASNDRDWQPEVANLPFATINGDMITIHNIRNFDYRSETDFDPRWEFNAGYVFGLTPSIDRSIFKVIIGRRFGGARHVTHQSTTVR